MSSREIEIPPEIINNVASLNLNQGCYEEARNLYFDAEAKIQVICKLLEKIKYRI